MPSDDTQPRTSVRPLWADLPPAVRESADGTLGSPVVTTLPQAGGFSPGLAVRAVLADGRRAFLKGIRTDHPAYPMYADEATVNRAMPAWAPLPRMLDTWEAAGWLLMSFEDIAGGHPDLSPGSADLPAVLRTLDVLPEVVSPSPIPDAPAVADELAGMLHGWQALTREGAPLDPWSTRHIDRLAAVERDWTKDSAGTCLLHIDLRADNMLMRDPDTALVIDWAYLHQGAPWLDPAFLGPQLIRAGHTPGQVTELLARVSSWRAAPPAAALSFAVAQAGYWERSSRLPAPPGVPYLRGYQAEMAAVGRDWVAYLGGWV
ncbi:phosphotransferase [Streptomyces sp. NPDC092296]|uniref:phosphotransferase n=1 Tax=Streptomyces sp. NPDC092296 TaxID=3366012 RepID=UPI00381803BA